MAPKKVLITGVYGLIAGAAYRHLRTQPDRYDVYGLARRSQLSERTPRNAELEIPAEKFTLADLTDYNAIAKAVEGMDVVVQLAADPRPDASWESLLGSNIVGPRNVLEAARRAGVRRVVFASSIMVSWGYQQEDPYKAISEGRFDAVNAGQVQAVTHEWPHRPDWPLSGDQNLGRGPSALLRRRTQYVGALFAHRLGQCRGPSARRAGRGYLVQPARRGTTRAARDRSSGGLAL